MKRFSKFAIGLLILLGGVTVAVIAFKTKPGAEKKDSERILSVVKIVPARTEAVTMLLPSQGLVEPRMKTMLAAEVGGKVISTGESDFEAGCEFAEGVTFVTIDPSDYHAAVAQAEAALADAGLAVETELAKADQAKRDWDRLGRTGEPSALTLRVPNVASANARKVAAEASLEKAKRDLDRTKIKAPFAGRIESTSTEKGAYLLPGSPVAEIYTTAPYEIRLPLALSDWALLERDENGIPAGEVSVTVEVGGVEQEFTGRIVRSEGQVERESRSIYVVAEIGGEETGSEDSLIQPGLFVKADVRGKKLENVIRVPVRAFRDLERVMVVGKNDNIVSFRKVKVLRRSTDEVLIMAGRNGEHGVEAGEWLCLTELADVIDGKTEVTPEVIVEPDQSLTGEPTPKP